MITSPKRKNKPIEGSAEKIENHGDSKLVKTNLKGDWLNLFLLILLYTMQGLPLGLSSSIPFILKSKSGSTFKEQAFFSFAFWPFSMKLLWAPLVDSFYTRKMGRRKSWLVPVQYLIGIFLIYIANDFENLIPETGQPNIMMLVYVFFAMNFLAATQDIAVDGWALTMLKKNNVGYASTCNSIGQSIGSMIGSMLPVLLTSESFCNKYLRNIPADGGIVTMRTLLYSCGIVFLLITSLVAILKKEKDDSLDDDHVKLNVIQTYSLLWDIIKLPSVKLLAVALLTSKIGFAATDNVTVLKLIDAGISKEDITMISTAMSGVNMMVPIVAGKYVSGPKAINIYLNSVPFRLLLNIPFILLIYYTPRIISSSNVVNIPIYYYVILVLLLSIHHILIYIMFITMMTFFSQISDPHFGGTYMTLLNTLGNLAVSLTSTAALRMIDLITVTKCSADSTNNCSTQDFKDSCKILKGDCIMTVNGYYVEMVLCTIIGIIWYVVFGNILKNLQKLSLSQWLVNAKKSNVTENENNSSSMRTQCDSVFI